METDCKKKKSLRNLIYRMRKYGYEIDRRESIAIMSDQKRNVKMERKIKEFGFLIQYKMKFRNDTSR